MKEQIMADTYPNFAALEQYEKAGIDYCVLVRREEPQFAIVAPHGGGIEPGTSEIADGIARQRWSFYAFEGLKRRGNAVLHITSTCFDEPMCLTLLSDTNRVITIHGEESEDDGEGVFMGGRDMDLRALVTEKLTDQGFNVRIHPNTNLQGLDPLNICNRGKAGVGVQLELSRSVRETFFDSLTREGRQHRKQRFKDFVEAVAAALAE
jgi:phage replication-related protein YjqB (UPF0714/DUF867 family)